MAGCTSSFRNTSQDTSVMPAVGDLPTMKRPMAKSAQGPAEAPSRSQKVPTAFGKGMPRPETRRPAAADSTRGERSTPRSARSEEHTSELQSLMRKAYDGF